MTIGAYLGAAAAGAALGALIFTNKNRTLGQNQQPSPGPSPMPGPIQFQASVTPEVVGGAQRFEDRFFFQSYWPYYYPYLFQYPYSHLQPRRLICKREEEDGEEIFVCDERLEYSAYAYPLVRYPIHRFGWLY